MPTLRIEQLSKTYPNGVRAVDGVSFGVSEGELLVLIGPSGCGKTTILRSIAGLECPSHGDIILDGESILAWPPRRRRVAMVFQRPALYPHLRVREHLSDTRLGEVYADRIGLSPFMERFSRELSGGEQQRVSLARTLSREAAILLLDEPLSNLDEEHRLLCRQLVRDVQNEQQRTTIYVTHDREEAVSLGDRVAVLVAGVLQQIDTPTYLYENPMSVDVATLLGSPPMQLLEGRLVSKEGLCLTGISNRLQVPTTMAQRWQPFVEREVIVGVRPEQVTLASKKEDVSRLTMQTTRVEWGIPTALVTLSRGDWQLLVHLPTRSCPRVGESLEVEVTLRAEYLFDGRTRQALPPLG